MSKFNCFKSFLRLLQSGFVITTILNAGGAPLAAMEGQELPKPIEGEIGSDTSNSAPVSYPYLNQRASLQPSETTDVPKQSSNLSAGSPSEQTSAVEDITDKSVPWLSNFLQVFPLHASLDLSETYDDNILIQPKKISDYITNVSPTFSVELGDKTIPNGNYLFALARPTFLLYADNPSEDDDDYLFDINYQHQFTRLTLGLEQVAQKLTSTNIDIGNRVQSDVYTTVGTATYDYNTDLSLAGSVTQNITDYQNNNYGNTTEWIADAYALYQLTPKLGLGLGPRLGEVAVQGGPDQTYEDGLVHLIYQATGKITITLIGGGEVREYENDAATTVTPTYELTVKAQPTDSTTLILDSNRHRVVSYGMTGDDYTDTGVAGTASQRFFQDVYVNLSAGYDLDQYEAVASGATGPARRDDYYFVRAGVEWKPKDWLDVTAFYQYSRDDSNFNDFSFNDNQVTVKATLLY
jgi:hypothetical protein